MKGKWLVLAGIALLLFGDVGYAIAALAVSLFTVAIQQNSTKG